MNVAILNCFPKGGMEKLRTDTMKLFLALYLVLIHSRGNTILANIAAVNFVLMVSGYLICSYFFFVSGYGLMTSTSNKPGYLQHFVRNRIVPFYTLYLIVLVFYTLYRFIVLKEQIVVWKIVTSLTFGGTYVIYGWFLQVMLLSYFLFLIVFSSKLSMNNKKRIFALCIIVYVCICVICEVESMWYDSVLALPLGIYVADSSNNHVKPHSRLFIFLIGAVVLVVLGNSSIVTKIGLPLYFKTIFKVIAPFFVLPIIFNILYFYNPAKNTRWLGTLSLYIYIVHGFVVSLFADVIRLNNQFLYIIVVYIITIVIAIVCILLKTRLLKIFRFQV